MCEWMEVFLVYRGRCRHRTRPRAAANPQLLPTGMRSEIVAILAGMFLEKQWEVAQ